MAVRWEFPQRSLINTSDPWAKPCAGRVDPVLGALIGPDLFLTAGHCFDAPQTQVTFNFQRDPAGNLRTEQRFPILAVLEHRLGGLDYAILRLDGNPGDTFDFALVSAVDSAVGDMVCIIGHPATAPKQIEAGPVTGLSGNRIRYNDAREMRPVPSCAVCVERPIDLFAL